MSAHDATINLEESNAVALDRLEEVMRGQHEGFLQLRQRLDEKRTAIAAADLEAIARLCTEEHEITQSLSQLEKCRLLLVGQLTEQVDPHAHQPLSVTDIAANVSEERSGRLRALTQSLRRELSDVRNISAVVREAAESLAAHLAGIVHGVVTALSRSGVYGPQGGMHTARQDRHAVDVQL